MCLKRPATDRRYVLIETFGGIATRLHIWTAGTWGWSLDSFRVSYIGRVRRRILFIVLHYVEILTVRECGNYPYRTEYDSGLTVLYHVQYFRHVLLDEISDDIRNTHVQLFTCGFQTPLHMSVCMLRVGGNLIADHCV